MDKPISYSCTSLTTVRNASSTTELHIPDKKEAARNEEKERESQRLATTDLEALLHVVKASLGSGLLAMPVAFKNAGLLEGLIGTIFVGIICSHGTHLLVKASQRMCSDLKKPSLGYADTVEAVFKTSPHVRLKSYASLGKKAVNLFLFLTYFGTNLIYVVLVASSLHKVVNNQFDIDWNIRWFMVMCLIPLLIVGTIRSMKYLVPFSVLANIFLFAGLIMTFYYVLQDIPPISSRPLFGSFTKFPVFFSTVLCGLEGIGTILPIENSMRTRHHFLGCPGVLNCAMIIIVSLFSIVGFFGYLKYGDDVSGSITLNLPKVYTAEFIKLLVALAILLTFGLQMSAVMEVVWTMVQDKIKKENQETGYYITRAVLVVVIVISAIAVPQLAPVLSLIGAVGFSTLGLFIPALVDLIMISEEGFILLSLNTWKNFFLIILAVLALVTGSYTSVLDIIEQYS